MKFIKIICIVIATVFLFSLAFIPAYAAENCNDVGIQVQLFRAGGGGSGGGSGGGGGAPVPHNTSGGNDSPVRSVLSFILFPFLFFATAFLFRIRVIKASWKTKRFIKSLEKKAPEWCYKDIKKQIRNACFLIQKSWTDMDMTPAKDVMSEKLFESFQTKLYWMSYKSQRNVLDKIKLFTASPVSLCMGTNNTPDHIWFYITGSMIDYIIDTDTNMKVNGKTYPSLFSEYWQFIRNADGDWVLNKILQKDESDQIVFTG